MTDAEQHPDPFRPTICPRCGRREGIPIVRGLPTPEAAAAAGAGRAILGGCVVGPGAAHWSCRACGHEWRHDDLPGSADRV